MSALVSYASSDDEENAPTAPPAVAAPAPPVLPQAGSKIDAAPDVSVDVTI